MTNARRSAFLRFAAWLAGAYVAVFGVDAALSVADEALQFVTAVPPLSNLRNSVALVVMVATVPLVILIIFVPQLPRRALVPLVGFQLWVVLGAPPVTGLAHAAGLGLALSALQGLLAVLALRAIKRATGAWWLTATRLPRIERLARRTAIALLLTSVAACAGMAALLVWGTVAYVEARTGGYMDFGWTGVELRATTLQRGTTTVHLVATAHFGDPGFYRDLRARIAPGALVFVEGVTDRNGRLRDFSYGEVAQALGLTTQSLFDALLQSAESEKAAAPAPGGAPSSAAPGPVVIRADIDTEALSERAIGFIRHIDALYGSGDFASAWAAFRALNETYTDAEVESVFEEIIDGRNRVLLDAFDRRVAPGDTVVLPWGALHMPGLLEGLRARGYRVAGERATPVARYRTLWEHWRGR